MGIYRYTLRAGTKTLGNVEVGQFKFAYKEHWDAHRSKVCMSLEAAGERACEALRDRGVELFVQGDWYDGQPVHWMSQAGSGLTEEFRSAPHVGWVVKDSRGRWMLQVKADAELLAEYPEIGELNTAEGKKFYFTDRKRDGTENGVQYQPSLNLYQVITNVRLMRMRNYY